MPRFVGLTGGIGSGKSTVAGRLAALGATIIDADRLARDAVAPGSPALDAIRARFGDAVFGPGGALDRAALGAIVFGDAEARAALNAIVHPEVARRALEAKAAAEAAGAGVVVYDLPLLYENGLAPMFDAVVVVAVPPEVQRARVLARDGASPEAIEARIAAQWPLAEKVARADVVIDNGGTRADTERQVDALWARWTAAA
jgi:dephospho-CoA kinase